MYKKATPIQILVLGYIILTIIGGVILCLPISSGKYEYTPFIDALFTAASAISTTGLGVVDTGSHFSIFGQIIILILIQIGGLGYMVFIAVVSFGIGARFSINGSRLLTESIARPSNIEIKKFIKAVILFTIIFESVGALLLTKVFVRHFPIIESIYSAVFHSISAFCTAGFSLYPDSFIQYADDMFVNVTIAIITIAGGIGFFVLYDLWKYFVNKAKHNYPVKLSDHTKLVLIVTFGLMIVGTIVLFFSEGYLNNTSSITEELLKSSFQSISASSTTGFNSIDIGSMREISLLSLIILMFIGASPGSTGGGIKTSTFGMLLLFLKKVIMNRESLTAFRRTIPESTANKAIGLTLFALVYTILIVFVLAAVEKFSLIQIFFETTSALGTVGLSMGITSSLSLTGKILIIVTMLVGRVGPLAIGYSLVGRTKNQKHNYPIGNMLAG